MRTKNLLATLFAAALLMCAVAARAEDAIKTVYHLPDERLATLAMNNIGNHLAVDPGGKDRRGGVVDRSAGLYLRRAGRGWAAVRRMVDQLSAKGVEFRICQNSMNALRLTQKDLIDKVSVVPSGVAEIARLQAREGFVYIHP